jgi:hypothetical protein
VRTSKRTIGRDPEHVSTGQTPRLGPIWQETVEFADQATHNAQFPFRPDNTGDQIVQASDIAALAPANDLAAGSMV